MLGVKKKLLDFLKLIFLSFCVGHRNIIWWIKERGKNLWLSHERHLNFPTFLKQLRNLWQGFCYIINQESSEIGWAFYTLDKYINIIKIKKLPKIQINWGFYKNLFMIMFWILVHITTNFTKKMGLSNTVLQKNISSH